MDPAEPDFEHLSEGIRLDPADANFVDVIHTNGAPISSLGYGLMQASGHVDFYVNGGEKQPGCKNQISGFFGSLLTFNTTGTKKLVSRHLAIQLHFFFNILNLWSEWSSVCFALQLLEKRWPVVTDAPTCILPNLYSLTALLRHSRVTAM